VNSGLFLSPKEQAFLLYPGFSLEKEAGWMDAEVQVQFD